MYLLQADKGMRGEQQERGATPSPGGGKQTDRRTGSGWLFLNHLCSHGPQPAQCPGRDHVNKKGRFCGEGPRGLLEDPPMSKPIGL